MKIQVYNKFSPFIFLNWRKIACTLGTEKVMQTQKATSREKKSVEETPSMQGRQHSRMAVLDFLDSDGILGAKAFFTLV
jgi:hypothetical protein